MSKDLRKTPESERNRKTSKSPKSRPKVEEPLFKKRKKVFKYLDDEKDSEPLSTN